MLEISEADVLEAFEAGGARRHGLARPPDRRLGARRRGADGGADRRAPTRASSWSRTARRSTPGADVLDEIEREVLRLRFAEDLTQSKIAEQVGYSQMHVSRILRRALGKLRDAAADQ